MTTEQPKYTLARRSYIPRAPGKLSEALDAGTEIVFEGRPGSNLLPANIAAIRVMGGKIGDAPDAERLAEMQAERAEIWQRLAAAQTERSRLLADDPKSPEIKRLRGEIADLRATHRELGEAIDMMKVRAIGQIDDVTHAANLAKCERAVQLAKNRAAIVNGPVSDAVRALADALITAAAHALAAGDLARPGLDFEQQLTLSCTVNDHNEAVANWVVSALVQLGGLPVQYRPTLPQRHGAESLAGLLNGSFAPEHPAQRRARTAAAAALDPNGRSYEENIARGRALDALTAQRAAGAAP